MGLTLKVTKDQLITELQTKVDEVNAFYDEKKAELEAEKAETEANNGNWVDYYKTLAEGFESGDFEMGDNRQPRRTDRANRELPQKPQAGRTQRRGKQRWYRTYDQELESLEGYRTQDLRGLDSALRLLRITSDDVVEVDSANYNDLLSINPRNRW